MSAPPGLLDGKMVIVTGAATRRGIGRATAALFATHGARLAILDIDGAGAERTARELGSAHRGYGVDLRDRAACDRAMASVLADFGDVDALAHIAGIVRSNRIMEISPADYDEVMEINLRGTMNICQAVIPHFREHRRGSIVCMSSVAAQRGGGIFGGSHYSASKAAILGLAKAMARELAPEGVRVNAVAPGPIDTDITGGPLTGPMRNDYIRAIPLGRIGTTEDVANAFLFLASDLSAYVTGAVLDVNGGMHIH